MSEVVFFNIETNDKRFLVKANVNQLDDFYNKEEEFGDASEEAIQVICDLIKDKFALTPDDVYIFEELSEEDFALVDIFGDYNE